MTEDSDIQGRRTGWSAALVGIGLMAAIDEVVFHQILAWHHFFDRSTGTVALLSDGLLHAAELIALGAGFVLLGDLLRRREFSARWAWAGGLSGAGAFQIFDGIVDHKILRLHQIRYGVENIIPYDVAWIGFGVVLLIIGLWLLRRVQRDSPSAAEH